MIPPCVERVTSKVWPIEKLAMAELQRARTVEGKEH
jgi:hypothetical protein